MSGFRVTVSLCPRYGRRDARTVGLALCYGAPPHKGAPPLPRLKMDRFRSTIAASYWSYGISKEHCVERRAKTKTTRGGI